MAALSWSTQKSLVEWGGVLSGDCHWWSKAHPGGGWSLSGGWRTHPSLGYFHEFRKRIGRTLHSNSQGCINRNESSKYNHGQAQMIATKKPGHFHYVETTSTQLFGIMEIKYLDHWLIFFSFDWCCISRVITYFLFQKTEETRIDGCPWKGHHFMKVVKLNIIHFLL